MVEIKSRNPIARYRSFKGVSRDDLVARYRDDKPVNALRATETLIARCAEDPSPSVGRALPDRVAIPRMAAAVTVRSGTL